MELPESVSCVPGTVVVLYGEAGLVKVDSTHCFFRLSDCWSCGADLRVGSRVHVNARLCPSSSRLDCVPYLCSTVWEASSSGASSELPTSLAGRVLSPPDIREVAQYRACVPGLQPLLSDTEAGAGPSSTSDLSTRIESQLAASIMELEGRRKKKKRRKSSEERNPGKHLDFLHKINDVIAELERDVPDVMARVRRDQTEKDWGTSYPTQEEYNAASQSSVNQSRTASNWLGLVVAPGSNPTPLQNIQVIQEEHPVIEPEPTKRSSEEEREDESPVKKSLFTDIFEAPEDRVPVGPNIHSSSTKVTEASRSQGPGLADLVKDRLCKVSTEGEEGSKGGGELASSKGRKRSLSRSQSEETRSRSRSRDRRKKKKDVEKPPKEKKNKLKSKHKHRSRSRSRHKKKKTKNRDYSKSLSRSPQKKKSKQKKKKEIVGRSRSPSLTKATKKRKRSKERSRSKSQKSKKKKYRRSSSRSEVRKSKSSSRETSYEWKKIERSKSYSIKNSSQERRRSNSLSQPPNSKPSSRHPSRSRSRTDRFSRSISRSKLFSKSKSKERSPLPKIEEKSSENSDEEDEETIVAKRRLERLKLLAKLKENKPNEIEATERENEPKVEFKNIIDPPPPPPIEAEKIPISFYGQETPIKEEENISADNPPPPPLLPPPVPPPGVIAPPAPTATPVVVTFDAEVLVIGPRSHFTQIGAFAWTSEPTFQPLSFFRYILVDLVKDRDMLTPGSRTQLMDSFRLKTSNFDVTRSGVKQVVFKHPEKGKVPVSKEKEALLGFVSYLSSLGGPVILTPHSKDAVLPVLLSLLTEHSLLDQFSATVAHFCDLVSLAWGLRMDSLWLGKKHPGLRVLAAAVCPDLVWKEGSLPADRTAANMWTVLERVRSRDPSLGLLAQAGGQTVVEYLSTKYSLLQCVRGEDVTRPYHVELGLGSEQWGRKLPLDLIWEKESVTRAKDRILERLREAEHDRRTPVPVPDMEEEEESVMIVRSKHSEQTHKCDSSHEKKTEHVKKKPKEVIAVKKEPVQPEVELKSYNAFLPPGVVTLTPGGPVTVLLKVPGLKLRLNDVVGRMVRVEQKEEFTLASITSKTGAVLQPRDSMFPAVEVEISSTGNEDTELDSKIVHYAVASVRV